MPQPTTAKPQISAPGRWQWLRWHVRAWLFIALGAAVFVFGAVILSKFTATSRQLEARLVAEERLLAEQRKLSERLDAVEVAGDEVKLALEKRIAELSAERRGGAEAPSPVKSPFPLEKVMGSIVEIVCIDNNDEDLYYTGSGTVIDKQGIIVTNHHILLSEDGSLIRYCGIGFTTDLQQAPNIGYIGRPTAIHKDTDLAILRITESVDDGQLPAEFPAITLDGSAAAASALNLGDPVYIGGYPDIGADTFTFTQGVVSGRVGPTFIKTSAIIDTGASGGAAFDSGGTYIGVPTAAARGEIGSSLGYLIGADVVDRFLADFFTKTNAVADPVD
jgi:S1-C subfamily serine protease